MQYRLTALWLILLSSFYTEITLAELRLPSSSDRRPNISLDPFERARKSAEQSSPRTPPQQEETQPQQPSTTTAEEEERPKQQPKRFVEKPVETKQQTPIIEQEAPIANRSTIADTNAFSQTFSIVTDLVTKIAGGAAITINDAPQQNDTQQPSDSKSFAWAGVIHYAAQLDTAAVNLWNDGLFALNLMFTFGTDKESGSTISDMFGDLQGVSSIDAGVSTFRLYEFYYEHTFAQNKSSLLMGIHDMKNDFYVSKYANLFLTRAFGLGTAINEAGSPSTYPATSFGIRYKTEFTPHSYFQIGAYDGNSGETNGFIDTTFNQADGALLVTEFGLLNGQPSITSGYYKLGIGGWYLKQDMFAFDENSVIAENAESENLSPSPGTGGLYLIAETSIGKTLGLFIKAGHSDSAFNRYARFYAGGLHYTGIIPSRSKDVLGFGVAHARQSAIFRALPENIEKFFIAETTYELTYTADIATWMSIQPAFQYIQYPNMDALTSNGIAFGIRIKGTY